MLYQKINGCEYAGYNTPSPTKHKKRHNSLQSHTPASMFPALVAKEQTPEYKFQKLMNAKKPPPPGTPNHEEDYLNGNQDEDFLSEMRYSESLKQSRNW